MTDPFDGACPVRWMVDDIGRYLAGDDAASAEKLTTSRCRTSRDRALARCPGSPSAFAPRAMRS